MDDSRLIFYKKSGMIIMGKDKGCCKMRVFSAPFIEKSNFSTIMIRVFHKAFDYF